MVERAEEGFLKSVALAPDFPMARFQLGQLYLVKGDAVAAKATLEPLMSLPANAALGAYARGLVAAADEDIDAAIHALQAGLACEQEIPALAGDMQRVLNNLFALRDGGAPMAPVTTPGNAAPLYLSNYGKANQ
jgi:tetratricopeptide (TPR) repeat protein